MGQILLAGDPPIEIRLRRTSRSRRMSLRVSGLDGAITMSVPPWTGQRTAERFAREQENWIRQQLERQVERVDVGIGSEVMVHGTMMPVLAGDGRAARVEGRAIVVPDDAERVGIRVSVLLKALARQRLVAACDRHAAALGTGYRRLTLRDTRSRWGSCSAEGNLMFSWRLVMAPPEVLDYVAAHEVAHLLEMNHSPRFWAQVERIVPGYRAPRKWLREHGARLHAFRFGN